MEYNFISIVIGRHEHVHMWWVGGGWPRVQRDFKTGSWRCMSSGYFNVFAIFCFLFLSNKQYFLSLEGSGFTIDSIGIMSTSALLDFESEARK